MKIKSHQIDGPTWLEQMRYDNAEGMVIDVSELQILLNLMGGHVKVNYPLYPFRLFDARYEDDGYRLKLDCRDSDFDKELRQYRELSYELPTYSDLRQSMISAGVLRYQNLKEFAKKLKAYHNMSKDVKFSLDTNMLYYKFVSNFKLIKPNELVMVKVVGEEIEDKLNHKYKHNQIKSLRRAARYQGQLFDELWNRKNKASRKAAYVASREYQYLMAGIADELDTVKPPRNSDWSNDRLIAETLIDLEHTSHVLPVLLTADDALVDICKTEGLEYFKFDIPYRIDIEHCNPSGFSELVFILAVTFGFVKLNSVVVFGEFKGKTSNRPDELKLMFLDENLHHRFIKDLKICRKLVKLTITR
jgi:hypothetical protein